MDAHRTRTQVGKRTVTGTGYDRTVSAALSETASKFALAEALALDIAPRRGRPARDETSTDQHLTEVREQVIEAGGEPKSVATLRNYRLTALWAKHPKTGSFRWVEDRCWSAHDEARQRGLSYLEFAALPREILVETVRDIFREGPARDEDEEEEEEYDLSAPVTFRPPVESGLVTPALSHSPRAAVPEPRPEPEREPEGEPEPEPGPEREPRVPEPREPAEREPGEPRRLNLVSAFRGVHRSVEQIAAEVAGHGVSPGERDVLLAEVSWITGTLAQVRKDIRAARSLATV